MSQSLLEGGISKSMFSVLILNPTRNNCNSILKGPRPVTFSSVTIGEIQIIVIFDSAS